MRLTALLAGMELEDALRTEEPWLGWARARDSYVVRQRLRAPEPRPALAQRPRKMSVTRVETWLANPYAIFARDILKLERLPELGASPDAALRGSTVHEIMSRFAKAYPDALPDDAGKELVAIAETVLARYGSNPRVAAFWLPRFERFAHWFAATEPARRAGTTRIVAEVDGKLAVKGPAGPFTLTARADRIDIKGRGILITDYKTGSAPKPKHVAEGLRPQLPLEAAIAFGEAGFTGVPHLPVTELRYISATGSEPPGDQLSAAKGDIEVLANAALASLAQLIARFDDAATPYRALRRARFDYRYDAYEHLARVAEWSVPGEDEVIVA
jgi:ATP-dependent helicase/nuclease subunit B